LIGLLTGIFVPAVIFGILFGIVIIVENYTGKLNLVTYTKILLLAVIPNLFLLRYNLIKLKHELNGRGIMTATFIYAIVFAVMEFLL